MTSVPVRVLMQDLLDRTDYCFRSAEGLAALPWEALTKRPRPNAWSAAECAQHLILYAQYYVPNIQAQLTEANMWKGYDTVYKATFWGDKFAKSMLPDQQGKLHKLKAPSNKRPEISHLRNGVILELATELKSLREVLMAADKFNVNRRTISVAIFPLLKINVGDALRFLVYHNQRHIEQALRAVSQNDQGL